MLVYDILSVSSEHKHILRAIDHGFVSYEGYQYPFLVFPYIKDDSLDKLTEAEHPWTNPDWSLLEIVDIITHISQSHEEVL
jgi:hypothetical protein